MKTNLIKTAFAIILWHVVADWKQNVQAYRMGRDGKPLSELKTIK